MRPINLIVIHCSASPNTDRLYRGSPGTCGFLNPAQVIDSWHVERGFHRADEWRARQNPNLAAIGYHYLIGRDGTTFTGRHVDEIPAQAAGFNQKAIGICLVGLDQFEPAQFETLAHLVVSEIARITGRNGPGDRNNPLSRAGALRLADERGIHICGHRDLPKVRKTCPGFEVSTWLANGMEVPNETPT
ncbi:MAG: N-acetylmuramoyl-L-alanine amidase [Rhodocyclales bacterium GT-UBC]|nr:MAG: N-acetylmuramoyl-L-alanine amidase [Rhodocyclales bacterium GT-UBC]